jgi:diacylglycerol kinase (ATP)
MTAPRAVVIVNPAASSGGAAARWPAIREQLERRIPNLAVRLTEAPGHATSLCRDALEAGAELVISVGGDGTNNEVFAGFLDEAGRNRFPNAVLGIVAAGTGGDFQRQFGVVSHAKQVERMLDAEPRTVDYGVVHMTGMDGAPRLRPFLNVASVGISGLVVDYVQTASRAFGAKAAYISSSLRGIANWRNRQVLVRFDDGEPQRHDLTLMAIANGQYFGAGMWACPSARLDDGQFDTLVMEGMTKLQIVNALGKVFNGKHLRLAHIHMGQARKVQVDVPSEDAATVLVEVDGELSGKLPATFEIVPNGVRIRVA